MKLSTAFLLTTLLATPALAQDAGDVLWTIDFPTVGRPTVAPDGTIYVGSTDGLHAISPSGQVLWTAPNGGTIVDVGPDGTVYTGRYDTIYAYAPDGTEIWSFTTDSPGLGLHSGPTLGPDGNLYAVFLFGLGIMSLTDAGEFRWNVAPVSNNDGPDFGRIVFGPGNLYFSEDRVPGCSNPWSGLVSVSFDGELEWCNVISGVCQPPAGPEATLDGRAIVWQNALPGIQIQVYEPDGSLDWTHDVYPRALGVGTDGNIYFFVGSTLVSMTPDGATRFSAPQPINNFPWKVVVSPDASAAVSGSVYGFGNNGRIIAADPADGDTLWSLTVTGPSAGVGNAVAFAPDSSVVYVPVVTNELAVSDQLWAVRVHDAPFESFCAGTAATCPCGNAGTAGRGCENSDATGGAALAASGATRPDTVVLEASGVKSGALSIFLQGDASASAVPFGDGARCVAGSLLRLYVRNATGPVVRAPIAGEPSISARSAQLGDPIAPGEARHYQVYYRDAVEAFCPAPAGGTFNASGAVTVAW